jgi:hypothetical protein
MLESVSVVEVILSVLVLALAADNISLRFKIKGLGSAVSLLTASLQTAVKSEFETVHARIDRLFNKGSALELQVATLAGEAKSTVSTDVAAVEGEITKISTGTDVPSTTTT